MPPRGAALCKAVFCPDFKDKALSMDFRRSTERPSKRFKSWNASQPADDDHCVRSSRIRVRGEGTTVRVFYYVHKADAIIVFHALQKRSQKTPSREISLARQRLQEVLNEKNKS
jgi:hypothetical protein